MNLQDKLIDSAGDGFSFGGKHVVIIPLTHAWNWTADHQRQAGLFFNKRAEVLAVDLYTPPITWRDWLTPGRRRLIRKLESEIRCIRRIHLIPFSRLQLIHRLNVWLSNLLVAGWIGRQMGAGQSLYWAFHPDGYPLAFWLKRLMGKRLWVVYDCLDVNTIDQGEFSKNYEIKERHLVWLADAVFAVSKEIKQLLERYGEEVWLLGQGFRLEDFSAWKGKRYQRFGTKPVVGYVGGINSRLDFDLLNKLVKQNQQWTFVLWGPKQWFTNEEHNYLRRQMKRLRGYENVLIGRSEKADIPDVVAHFDVGIVPYKVDDDFNRLSVPIKVFEYLAMGVPVVASKITSLERLGRLVTVVNDYNDWQNTIERTLSENMSNKQIEQAKKLVEKHGYTDRFERGLAKLEEVTSKVFRPGSPSGI